MYIPQWHHYTTLALEEGKKNSRARDGDEFHEIHRHKMIECKATLPVMWEY